MKRFFLLLCLPLVLFLLPPPTCQAEGMVEIVLKNGGVVKTDEYYEEGGQICFYRYGALMRIPMTNVLEIREVQRDADVEEVVPDPSAFKAARPERGRGKTGSGGTPSESECERKLRMFRRQVEIYCGQAAHEEHNAQHVHRMPNLPRGNRVTVSKETADRFKAHVQTKVRAFRANRNCQYYRDMVEYWEKKCGR